MAPALAAALVSVAVSLPGAASAQALEQALIAAYTNNPTLVAGRARLRATDEAVAQALSGWRPSVTASAEVGRSATTSSSAFYSASEDRNLKNYRLSLNQPLYRGGRTIAGTRQAENLIGSERARLLETEQDVLLSAATAYMDVVRDQAVLRLNVGNEQVLRRRLEATRDQFEVGEITRTDVSQAEARLAGATADRIRSEGDLESARAVYRNVIGIAPGEISAPGPVTGLPDSGAEAVAASEMNPSVSVAVYSEKAAMDGIDLATGELLPTVSLNGEVRRNEDSFSRGSIAETGQVTAQFSVPLYQSGAAYSRVREARQTVMQRRSEVEGARRSAAEAATRAWEALQAARARIRSFQAQIEANEIALEGVKQEATVGSRTILDILDAQQELLDSRVSLVRAERDQTVAEFELKAAIGRLTARDLGLAVQIYDEKANYDEVRDKFWGTGVGAE